MVLWSGKPIFNSYMMRAAIKDEKALIDELRIGIGGITYTQKSSLTYSRVRSVSAVTFFDLKKHYTLPGYLFCGKK